MIGSRTRYSLAQYLELHETAFVVASVNKHGIRFSTEEGRLLTGLINCFRSANDEQLLSLIEEIARTDSDLRARVEKKYRHEERFGDLRRCLQLDGYIIENKRLTQTDPSISDAPPLDDDLLIELNASGLSNADEIVRKVNSSSELFRSSPHNYNACLNDIRVALVVSQFKSKGYIGLVSHSIVALMVTD